MYFHPCISAAQNLLSFTSTFSPVLWMTMVMFTTYGKVQTIWVKVKGKVKPAYLHMKRRFIASSRTIPGIEKGVFE